MTTRDVTPQTGPTDAFLAEFLPPGARSAHDLLYGSTEFQLSQWAPNHDQVLGCLNAFEHLVRGAVGGHPPGLHMLELDMEATELVIAYVTRSQQRQGFAEVGHRVALLIRRWQPDLEALVRMLGGAGTDALKRLITIAELLQASE